MLFSVLVVVTVIFSKVVILLKLVSTKAFWANTTFSLDRKMSNVENNKMFFVLAFIYECKG